MHVLVVSRWYPAFDNPSRGSFVADQVAALTGAMVDVRVVSWETAYLRGAHGVRMDGPGHGGTPGPLLAAISAGMPGVTPLAWGAPGVPVARLPATTPVAQDGSVDLLAVVNGQADTLLAHGRVLAARWPIDAVHAHTGLPDGLAAIPLADELGVPLIVTEHDSTIPTSLADDRLRDAYRALLAPGRRLVTVGSAIRSRLAELLEVAEDRIEVVPNVVDVAAFGIHGPGSRDANELLWVGGRSVNKGTDVLLDAFRVLHEERPELRLRLIGRAPTEKIEEELRGRADELGVSASVAFEPSVDRAGVADAMARAAVFVHPSPFETFGVVAAEALASGLPIAAVPSGGVDEIVGDDGTCGVVARGPDAAALADAVREVLARRMSFEPNALRGRVEARFAPNAVASHLVGLYRREIERRSATEAARATLAGSGRPVGADPPAVDAPAAPATMSLPLVLGLRRPSTARRIRLLPAGLAAGLTVVTGGVDGLRSTPDVLPAGPRWIEIDHDRRYREAMTRLGGARSLGTWPRRVLRAARHPIVTIRRRRLAARRDALALDAIRTGLRTALEQHAARRVDGEPLELLPLDVDDLVLALPVVDPRFRWYPSTLRGLVDDWDARGRPGLPPAAAAHSATDGGMD